MDDQNKSQNAYSPLFFDTYIPDVEYESFNLSMPDDRLEKLLIDSLDENVSHWQQKPWQLQKTDNENTNFLLGDQHDYRQVSTLSSSITGADNLVDNRMFASYRAILSYATGQLAVPEITPSRDDDIYVKGARDLQSALYQHAANNQVEHKTRVAVGNLITRKRGPMKLRWDANKGMYGDIVTEVVPPEDIIVDRFARYLDNPNVIYQRVRCSIEELIARFPDKEAEIKQAYSIKQGRYTQMSRYCTYFEAWFSYVDSNNKPKEGVCWFIPEYHLILDKMPNPNWIYTGDDKKDKQVNVLDCPPKPFVWFNYLNTGHSYIDDTCLFEQAKPLQDMLNYRNEQLNRNIDFMNGRWVASKKAFSQEDAQKFVNKGARTVAIVDSDDVTKAITAMTPTALPSEVYQSVVDFRNEIDQMMGTPSIFKGASPDKQDTLGRDLMIKQQAGLLQDDLVRAVAAGMETYYKILLQMMRTYYTDDYWFQVQGGDGKYEFILINGDNIDSNVRVGVQVDSTLPLDKTQIRATALELWKANQSMDYMTLMKDLGLPNPDIRTELYMKSKLDPVGYLRAVEGTQIHDQAEADIQLLISGKVPDERDKYDQEYLAYFNDFLTTNRFAKLEQGAKQRVVQFLMAIQHLAVQSANLQALNLDEANMIPLPPPAPVMPGVPSGAPVQGQPPTPGSPQLPPNGGLAAAVPPQVVQPPGMGL